MNALSGCNAKFLDVKTCVVYSQLHFKLFSLEIELINQPVTSK